MNDRDFITAFEACAIANNDFHHTDHIRVAWCYLRNAPLLEAIESFTGTIRAIGCPTISAAP